MSKKRPKKTPARRQTGRAQAARKDTAQREVHPPVPELNVDNFPELPALVHYVRQGRCTLFVGAGLSRGAGLPSWRELMERLIPSATPLAVEPERLQAIERLHAMDPVPKEALRRAIEKALGSERSMWLFARTVGLPPGGNLRASAFHPRLHEVVDRIQQDTRIALELQKLMEAGKFAELAGFCRDLLGRERFHQHVRKELLADRGVPATHRAIVRTPWASIVTTNFDDLLERAYKEWQPRGVPKAPTGAELAQQGTLLLDDAFFILKAHGDLDDESSIVFTSEDYRRVIHSNPAFQAMLAGILLTRAVLFVGYSLSDPNFRLLLDNQLTIFNEQVPPRYALMDGVGDAEREILWRTAKLRVFSYERGSHEVVGRFLNTLANRAGGVRGEPTSEATPSSSPAAATRQPLNLMKDIQVATLAVHATGDLITLDLYEQDGLGSARRTWSGGSQWPDWSTLSRQITSICATPGAKLADVSALGDRLQGVIPGDLQDKLRTLPPETTVALSLSPETEIIPWEWLIVEGSPLCLRNPVVRRPVGISDKARGLRCAGTPLRALLVGDAGGGDGTDRFALSGAATEVQELAELLQKSDPGNVVRLLQREQAVYARLVEEVDSGDYDIIHFAGHAWYEQSQALLYLWDGRVTSSELSSLLNRQPPALFFLNSHYTAFVPSGIASYDYSAERWQPAPGLVRAPGVDRPAPSALGFTGPAARSGVGAFVGSFAGALGDKPAADFALEFYRRLLEGSNFAAALHSARKATTSFGDVTGMYYTGTGYPGLLLAGG